MGWQLAVLTISRLFLNTGLRMVYPFLPAFSRALGVSILSLSQLIFIRNFASLLSPLFSPISERYGRRVSLVLSMVVFTLGGMIVVLWPAYWFFGASLSIMAIAKVIYDPAMQAYIGDTVPYERRGKAISVTELSWAGAFFLGVPAVGFIIQRQGWQAAFFWLGFAGLAAAVALWRILPAANRRTGEAINLRATAGVIRSHRVIWAAFLYIFLAMGANELLLIVYGGWMESSFNLNLASLGLATAVIGAAEIMGEISVGFAVDWLGKRPVIITTGLLSGLMYFLIPYSNISLGVALVALFILFLFFEMTVVGGIPLMTELVPSARSVVMSVILAAGGTGRAFGALVGPVVWDAGGLRMVGAVAAVVMVLAVLILVRWVHEASKVSTLHATDT